MIKKITEFLYENNIKKINEIIDEVNVLKTNTAQNIESSIQQCMDSLVASIATGTANGTISVEKGSIKTDIPVKGLKSAAYRSEDDFALNSHQHTSVEILDLNTTINTAIANKANVSTSLNGYGITDAYTITAADAKFAMLNASNLSAENVTAWSTKLGTGSVASGNTELITGGTVFTETRVASNGNYIQTTNSAAANLSALDTQVKANTDAIGDANSGLAKAVANNAAAITGKADKSSIGNEAGKIPIYSAEGHLILPSGIELF